MVHGEIPTAINVPLPKIKEVLEDEGEWKKISNKPYPAKDKHIVFTCRSGSRAEVALKSVQNLGYKNVDLYKGSYVDWFQKNY